MLKEVEYSINIQWRGILPHFFSKNAARFAYLCLSEIAYMQPKNQTKENTRFSHHQGYSKIQYSSYQKYIIIP